MPDLEEFETHDIYLAAYLQLAGCSLKNRRKQGPRVYFVFTNVGGPINELREAYFSGKAIVHPHAFAQLVIAYKQLCWE